MIKVNPASVADLMAPSFLSVIHAAPTVAIGLRQYLIAAKRYRTFPADQFELHTNVLLKLLEEQPRVECIPDNPALHLFPIYVACRLPPESRAKPFHAAWNAQAADLSLDDQLLLIESLLSDLADYIDATK